MTIQTTPIAVAPKQHKTRLITAAAGALLALIAAAGIGAWQMSRDGGTSVVEQQAPSIPVPAERAALAEAAGPVVYIAATQEQAADLLRFSGELNALRTELGQPQVSVGVLVVEPHTALALDALPSAPGTRVFDLRPVGATAASARVTTNQMANPVGEPATAAAHTLVVASPGDLSEAYARFVERHTHWTARHRSW